MARNLLLISSEQSEVSVLENRRNYILIPTEVVTSAITSHFKQRGCYASLHHRINMVTDSISANIDHAAHACHIQRRLT